MRPAIVDAVATTRAIRLKTEVPGPRSRSIVERKERVIAKPMSLYLPIDRKSTRLNSSH